MRTPALLALVIAATLLGGSVLIALAPSAASVDDGKLQVIATFYPLYYFANEIGGGRADVSMIIPDNMEPHSFDPRPSDIVRVARADVLVFNGAGFEPWLPSVVAQAPATLIQVDTSKNLEANMSGRDPHFWLDPLSAQVQVEEIAAAMCSADPGNATFYQSNAAGLNLRLADLDRAFTSGLQNRTRNAIVTTHEGFDYMATRYDFSAYAAIGISAEAQPSIQALIALANQVRALDLHYVYTEPVFSDAVMHTVAAETGAGVLVLDGIHGRSGVHAGMDYFQIMYANLASLRTGLEVTS
jgi:zinc transport system substrate-binding protein